MKNFLEELEWRGMLHDKTAGIGSLFEEDKPQVVGYIGFDPTADSLHVGSLAQIMTLKLFQACGHRAIVLIGDATAQVGDPSGKTTERARQTEEEYTEHSNAITLQLVKLLEGGDRSNPIVLKRNQPFYRTSLLRFLEDVGSHFTVNYMLAKESVKGREGLSFKEFSYSLLQAYDYYRLFTEDNCTLQMGGSDQWGNITSGIELIRRVDGAGVHGLTTKLITKADGTKFGKTEEGTVWLDPEKTSPFAFYQYWFNTSDEDALKYLKVFTLYDEERITMLYTKHQDNPSARVMQKELAYNLTGLVHSIAEADKARMISYILFDNTPVDELERLSNEQIEEYFSDIIRKVKPAADMGWLYLDDMLVEASICTSKSEVRRLVEQSGITLNKSSVCDNPRAASSDWAIIKKRYLFVQKGKKNCYLIDFKE